MLVIDQWLSYGFRLTVDYIASYIIYGFTINLTQGIIDLFL